MLNASDRGRLLKAAATVSRRAHAPYSKFEVGCALLVADGKIVTGCNVENISYGLTICAERNAIFHAVASGAGKIRAIAIVASGAKPPFPCGACRQVMAEFCGPKTLVVIAPRGNLKKHVESTLGELLPLSFKF